MKTISLLFSLILTFSHLLSQNSELVAPLNSEFIRYSEYKKSGKWKASEIVPSPRHLDFLNLKDFLKSVNKLNELPERYDSREFGIITPVKNQNPYGTCWAFSSNAAIEAYWKKLGFGEFDLSEKNMITCNGFEWDFNNIGGNFDLAFAYLSRRDGPVYENDDNYNSLKTNPECLTGLKTVAYADEIRYLPNNIEIIKQAIMNYGGVATEMTFGQTYNSPYYDPETHTFWYNGQDPVDHGVLIIGWDDNKYIYRKFGDRNSRAKGAWIAKNSWGTSWGESGFFYVSYNDTKFLNQNAVFPSRNPIRSDEKLFMYDHLGNITSYKGKNYSGYGIIKYNSPTSRIITKVGTFINSMGASVDIEVYSKFDTLSLTPKDLIVKKENILCDFPGYYTFDITAKVKGDFFVKVNYHTPGNTFPIPVELVIENYCNPQIEKGVCWVSEDDVTWEPIGKDTKRESDLCIRVYAREDHDNPLANFTCDKKEVCLGSQLTIKDDSQGGISEFLWDFGEGADPISLKNTLPGQEIKVTYKTQGDKIITLTVSGDGKTDKLSRHIKVTADNLQVLLTLDKPFISLGKTAYLLAIGDVDEFIWDPMEVLDPAKGRKVMIKPATEGDFIYSVMGLQGNCFGKSSVTVRVRKSPDNDDVANALMLNYGMNGPFTNAYATIEDNEPYPDTTMIVSKETGSNDPCNSQSTWCHEGGLQNSVWFKVIPKENGFITIDSHGMDNQMALYDADSYENLFEKSKYKILAANDDYHPEAENFAARITTLRDLVPGKTYWLQVDGSHGGDVGKFSIEMYNGNVGIQENKFGNYFFISPNPNNGNFQIYFNYSPIRNYKLIINDLAGKIIYFEENHGILADKRKDIVLKDCYTGAYIARLVTDDKIYSKMMIINTKFAP